MTPIFVASEGGHYQVVELLLAAGADPNEPENEGVTPLFVATEVGRYQVVKILLAAGANPNAQLHDGRTALDAAKALQHHSIIRLLECVPFSLQALCFMQLRLQEIRSQIFYTKSNKLLDASHPTSSSS